MRDLLMCDWCIITVGLLISPCSNKLTIPPLFNTPMLALMTGKH